VWTLSRDLWWDRVFSARSVDAESRSLMRSRLWCFHLHPLTKQLL